jgi:hypothetical protein
MWPSQIFIVHMITHFLSNYTTIAIKVMLVFMNELKADLH